MRTKYQRMSISLVLAMAIATVFTLSSFAAPEVGNSSVDPVLAQDCTGTLTVKGGQITINGNAAQTGATVMTGSTITSSNGSAIIDLGAAGRVEMEDNITITLICAGGSIQFRSTITTEVEVRKGSLNVTSPTAGTLAAGQKGTYTDGIVATGAGAIDVKVQGGGKKKGGAGLSVGPGLVGILTLIGIGVGVFIGVAVGGGESSTPSSPVR